MQQKSNAQILVEQIFNPDVKQIVYSLFIFWFLQYKEKLENVANIVSLENHQILFQKHLSTSSQQTSYFRSIRQLKEVS